MAAFRALIAGLKRAERQLTSQLEGIRSAIATLEMGGGVSPSFRRGPGRPKRSAGSRKRRTQAAKKS